MITQKLKINRQRRKQKVRAKIKANANDKLRLSVFRSNKHFYAQLINISEGKTLLSISDISFMKNKKEPKKLSEIVLKMGVEFGQKMIKQGISEAVFDRSFYKFHGLVKNFAQGVRQAGVKI